MSTVHFCGAETRLAGVQEQVPEGKELSFRQEARYAFPAGDSVLLVQMIFRQVS